MNSRCFAIPDIHGCALTFRRLVEEVIRLDKGDSLYLLGDMIDRGPRSREVVDTIRRLQAEGYAVHPLRGNHEDMLVRSCVDRNNFHLWMLNGGRATLDSFGIEDACELPSHYRAFFEELPFYIELDDFILVHAGLNFQAVDPLLDTEAMLWTRSSEVKRERIKGKRVICGHTPQSREAIRRSLSGNRITLDNGCVYAGEPELGNLTALELNSMTLYFQENID